MRICLDVLVRAQHEIEIAVKELLYLLVLLRWQLRKDIPNCYPCLLHDTRIRNAALFTRRRLLHPRHTSPSFFSAVLGYRGGMSTIRYKEAVELHRRLSEAEWLSLRDAGIPAGVAFERLIGWNGEYVTIPVFSYDRKVVFFERAAWRDDGSLAVVPRKGGRTALYGVHLLRNAPPQVVIVEDAVESLVLAGQSFAAVAATGRGRVFKEEWTPLFRSVREVFVCFRRSEESAARAEEIAAMIPQALVVHLPESVGEGGGVWDFFMRLARTRRDFLRLLSLAGYA